MKNNSDLKGVLGLGSVSTGFYLKKIHNKYQEKNKEFSTCPLVVYQIDFQELNPFLPNNFEVLIPRLKSYFKSISNLGITKLLIPNITLHETLDQIETPLKICHPIDLTIQYLNENQIFEVYIFATLYTTNSDYIQSRFSENKIQILKPTVSDQNWIDDFRKRVYEEQETLEETALFQNLIQKYSNKENVVIACTELSVFYSKENPSCIHMMDLQIDEFLK